MIEKTCKACGAQFGIYPSWEGKVVCCSRTCRNLYKYQQDAKEVCQMTDIDRAWFAGLFDGEGSKSFDRQSRWDNIYPEGVD